MNTYVEARIDALTTKDKAKLAIFIEGYDSHAYNAYHYWIDQFPDIKLFKPEDGVRTFKVGEDYSYTYDFSDLPLNGQEVSLSEYNVATIKSFKENHSKVRDNSKSVTFALQYKGTWKTLVNNSGFSPEEAQKIVANYKALYKESEAYSNRRIKQATVDGYVTVAFGLRIRTPLLAKSILGNRTTLYEAEAEARTVGNALSQSYGLLNNRAAVEFMEKVWASPYKYKIKPVALIHDAIYIMMVNDVEVVEWANRELIKSMNWQELPEIQHPEVGLPANLDLFYPSWNDVITLPNNATQQEIMSICQKHMENLDRP